LLAAVLATDSIQVALLDRPVVLDAHLRDAGPRARAGIKVQAHPLLLNWVAESLPAGGLKRPLTVRPVDAIEAAQSDTVLISIAEVHAGTAHRDFVVQLRHGTDWTGYRQYGVRLERRGGAWYGRVQWSAEP
jgi:hypothetical protein